MAKLFELLANESLWQWGGMRAPTIIATGTTTGEPVNTSDDFRGFAVRQAFQRGRLPMDQFIRGEKRFLEPIGFSADELVRTAELGYFRTSDTEPPRKMELLAQEMVARAAGAKVLSPRDGDQVTTWDFIEGGEPGRLIVLLKGGAVQAEERGLGSARPELKLTPEACLQAGKLRTSSPTREQSLEGSVLGPQDSLRGGGKNLPLSQSAAPPASFRDLALGRVERDK